MLGILRRLLGRSTAPLLGLYLAAVGTLFLLSLHSLRRLQNSFLEEPLTTFARWAVESEQARWDAQYARGEALAASGQHRSAAAALETLYRRLPRFTLTKADGVMRRRAIGRAGELYVESGRRRKAILAFEQLLDESPGSAEGHVRFGSGMMRLGRGDEAARHFESALALDPNLPTAVERLIVHYSEARQPRAVVATYERYRDALCVMRGFGTSGLGVSLIANGRIVSTHPLNVVVDGEMRSYRIPIEPVSSDDGEIHRIDSVRLGFIVPAACHEIELTGIRLMMPRRISDAADASHISAAMGEATGEGFQLEREAPGRFRLSGDRVTIVVPLETPIESSAIDAIEIDLVVRKRLSDRCVKIVERARRELLLPDPRGEVIP